MTSSTSPTDPTQPLRRESGAFAMLAVDQREALRLMFAGDVAANSDGSVPAEVLAAVPDSTLTDFKLKATKILSPYASAVLMDRQFVWDAAMEQGVVAAGCAPIIAADQFVPGNGEVVTAQIIDEGVDFVAAKAQGAVAAKLLVIYREDESAQERVDMVVDFIGRCTAANLISIIEPVCKAPRHGGEWDWNAGVHAAAHELGSLGADLYKAEVPLKGLGTDAELLEECIRLGNAIASPWVVLSSGVAADDFPRAVEIACQGGASGFLAGRAVWRACVDAPDVVASLEADAVPRLQRLVEIVDRVVGNR
ncbi:aldolase [Salinibacterium sp. PAMC 21357]|uniref:aldolase n=1 Tax=Salinibacterium sp. PAMC 21357 TaxID=1112215 RepID=UPI000289F641|nr:aldolase [Salinibacterium sp. PAMC 21357]